MNRVLVALALLTLSCHGPTDPDVATRLHGRLSGVVNIGPNCPGPQQPCPTPPSAYALRKVLVYNESRSRLLFTVDIDSQGAYFIDLPPGSYIVDLQRSGIDTTKDLPKNAVIRANLVTRIDINIDTGIR